MHPYTVTFGGGADSTILHPVVLAAMLLSLTLIFMLRRRYVVAPLVITTFLVPLGQQLYFGGIHLFVNRILVLAAFLRVVVSKCPDQPLLVRGWTFIDTAMASYTTIVGVATMMQYPSTAALVNQLGFLWDFLLAYLVLRSLVRDERDGLFVIKCFVVVAVVFAAGMIIEQTRGINVFGMLGGVAVTPELRLGHFRSQAAFQHSLTAGTFAATSSPLFAILWLKRQARWISMIGIAAALIMIVTTQTSTSLLTLMAGASAICIWPLRRHMRALRMGLAVLVVSLDLVMKAPVWFIIARIDLTGSSSSYHRAELIEQCVTHFSRWWLIGTKDVSSWGWDMWDAQNMFVSIAEAGGLLALIFFVLAISTSFGKLGTSRQRARSRRQEWVFWLLGASLFAHVTAFFGVNYFDQCRLAWFSLLSMICACAVPGIRARGSSFATPFIGQVPSPDGRVPVEAAPESKLVIS